MPVSAHAPLLLPGYLHLREGRPLMAAAVALQQGVLTTISPGSPSRPPGLHLLYPPPAPRPATTSLRLNGQSSAPPWSIQLLSSFASDINEVPLRIEQTTILPDLGAPTACARALSLALALNAHHQSHLSPGQCAQLATQSLTRAGQPLGFGIHLEGGLLSYSPSHARPQRHLLSPAELRMPTRLSFFGSSHPKPLSPLKAKKAARASARLFNPHPSLLSLAAASRKFALLTHPARFWASDLLAPRPGAGLAIGSKTIFEPGVAHAHPMVHPLHGPPPHTLIVHPTNHGARVL